MLSIFPSLTWMHELSPFLIRLTIGIVLIHWSYRRLKGQNETNGTGSKVIGLMDAILGLMFIAGFLTQIAAIILAIDLLIRIVKKAMKGALLTDGVNYYLILLVLCISLMVTGAGWYAFDLAL